MKKKKTKKKVIKPVKEFTYHRKLASWQVGYAYAKKYYEHHGNLVVPLKFVTQNGYEEAEEGYALGVWIKNQRMAYANRFLSKKNNSYAPLSDEQVELLTQIGMVFEIKKSKIKNILFCQELNLDCEKYPYLQQIPYPELIEKVKFLRENNLPLTDNNGVPNLLFFSSGTYYEIMKNELLTHPEKKR